MLSDLTPAQLRCLNLACGALEEAVERDPDYADGDVDLAVLARTRVAVLDALDRVRTSA